MKRFWKGKGKQSFGQDRDTDLWGIPRDTGLVHTVIERRMETDKEWSASLENVESMQNYRDSSYAYPLMVVSNHIF